jgi:hypothetical protein
MAVGDTSTLMGGGGGQQGVSGVSGGGGAGSHRWLTRFPGMCIVQPVSHFWARDLKRVW